MTTEVVPDAVRELIAERIDSIPELEALLLFRQHRNKAMTAEEASKHLFLSPKICSHILHLLTERGFLSQSLQRFQYAPVTPELKATVTLLAQTYSKHLIALTKIVHAKSSSRTI